MGEGEDIGVFVRLNIPDDAPPCEIRYSIEVRQGSQSGSLYVAGDIDLQIKSK